MRKSAAPSNHDEYLAGVSEPASGTLKTVRAAIRTVVPPETKETIWYGIPTFDYNGPLVSFAAFSRHCSLFPLSAAVIVKFKDQLKGLKTSKGTIQFPVDEPLSAALVTKIVKARIAENERTKKRPDRDVSRAARNGAGTYTQRTCTMELGNFSISLAVKDLAASRAFYEKFGFKPFAGDASMNWLIMKNGDHVIGLFQGMFEKNTLTFNPGWDSNAQQLSTFTDVRELQRRLKAQGVALLSEADESTTGPASFFAMDPDGNPILVDQHV